MFHRLAALAVLLLGTAGLVVGCTSSSHHPSTSSVDVMTMPNGQLMTMTPGQPNPMVSTTAGPSVVSTPSASTVTGNEATPTDETADFRTYLTGTFGGSPTLAAKVTKVYLQAGAQYAQTTLTTASADKSQAGQLCAALGNYGLSKQEPFGGVYVLDASGARIAVRTDQAGGCG